MSPCYSVISLGSSSMMALWPQFPNNSEGLAEGH